MIASAPRGPWGLLKNVGHRDNNVLHRATTPLSKMQGGGGIKQRIQSSHMPPCHRHMVIATHFSSMFDLLLCSTPAECCLELTTVSGYRMFLGPFG